MPLLKNGEIIQDDWITIENEIPDPLPQAPIIVPFSMLPSFLEDRNPNHPIGVSFPTERETDELKPYLDKLGLIALIFPVFKDGRAFSQASKIRAQLKFTGELRATGHILPDQYQFLIRTGFTTVSLSETEDLTSWKKAMHDFDTAYQPSILHEKRLPGLHWKL